MSWLGRNEYCWKVNTPDQVGPGAYSVQSSYQSKYGSAPFDSCEPRMTANTSQNSPGYYIGHSSWNSKMRCSTAFSDRSKVAGFGTSAIRMADIKTISPGPGAYSLIVSRSFPVKQTRKPIQMQGVEKSPSSIPSREVGQISIGPGSYTPKMAEKDKGTNFGVSGSKREVFDVSDLQVGPGHYDPDLKGTTMTSWMFNSGSKRPWGLAEIKPEMPGPGHYQISANSEIKKSPVSFGSKVKRDIKTSNDPHRPYVAQNSTVPPLGTYLSKEEQDKVEKLKKKLIANDYPIEKVPFGTSEKKNHELISSVPGPGHYQPSPSVGNQKVFVPKSPRFIEKNLVTPGPGTYSPSEARSRKTQKFTSRGPRFQKSEERLTQGHLTYQQHINWNVKQTRSPDFVLIEKKLSFDTTSLRFVSGKHTSGPGPGQYDFRTQSAPKKSNFLGNGHSDTRPKTGTSTNIGPGTYNVLSSKRKTFNMAKEIGKDNIWL